MSSTETPEVTSESPWLGLRSFSESTRNYFFGRDEELGELFERVAHKPLTIIFGKSGLGKTSLLQAGLIPRLREAGLLPVSIRLDFADQSPPLQKQVFTALLAELRAAGFQEHTNFPLNGISFWELFHNPEYRFIRPDGTPIVRPVLIFDQVEEIFTLGEHRPSDALAFRTALSGLVENRPPDILRKQIEADDDLADHFVFRALPCKVLLSLREDYLHQLERWRRFMPSLMDNRFELRLLNGPKALLAVHEPGARRLDKPPIASRDTATAIVRFVAGAAPNIPLAEIDAVPPLLSLICAGMNTQRLAAGQEQITPDQLSGRSEDILEKFYHDCFKQAPSGLRELVEDRLLSEGGHRESLAFDTAVREIEARAASATVAETAIANLVKERLLVVEERGGVRRIELTHDILTGVARRSRDLRREREATEKAERERLQAEKTAVEQRRKTRRARVIAGAFILLFLATLAALFLAIDLRNKAQSAAQIAKTKEAEAQAEKMEVEQAEKEALKQTKAAGEARLRAQSLKAAWRGVNMAPEKLDLALLLSAEAFRGGDPEAKNALLTSLLASPHLKTFLRGNLFEVRTSDVYRSEVRSLAFSPDGRMLASADGNGTIILWHPDSGFMVRKPFFRVHADEIYAIAFSPDGRLLASASADKTVKLIEVASGVAEKLGGDPDFDFRSVAFSPDGDVLAAACGDGTVRRWDIANKQPISSLFHHDRKVNPADVPVNAVAFSPQGDLLASAGEDDQLLLWDVKTGTRKHAAKLGDPERPVFRVAFSPKGDYIATSGAKGAITLWSASKLERIYGPVVEHDRGIYGLEFSPDGNQLASASADQSARLWDVDDMKNKVAEPSKSLEGYSEGVYSIAFSPFADTLATGHADGTITLWNLSDHCRIADRIEFGDVNALAFGLGGKLLVSAQGKAIVVWDAGKRKWQTDACQGHEGTVTSVATNPRGSLIASASRDGTIRLWDSASGRQLGPSLKRHSGSVNAVAFSPRGDLLASASDDKAILLWKIGDQRPADIDASFLAELLGHADAVTSVAFSPDGKTLASGSADKTVRLWNVITGQQIGPPLAKHAAAVFCVAFHPDGTRLVSGDRDGSLILWDRATGKPLATKFAGHNGASVIGLAFHPNGKTLFSAGWHATVVQWDLNTGKAIGPPLANLGHSTSSLAMDPSGSLLAAGNPDAINVLELTGAKPASYVLESGLQSVSSLAISHDGATLAAGGTTGNILCWDTRTKLQKGIPLSADATGISRLFFSPDDRLLGAVSKERIVFWNLDTGKETSRLVETSEISDAVFDPAGGRLATGTAAGSVNLWDWPSLKRRAEQLKSHDDRVRSLVFTPDGRRLFSCGDDETSILHDLSATPPTSLPFEFDSVTRIATSQDGKTFAFGKADGSIDIDDASLNRIGILKHHKAPISQLTFSPDGKELASVSWSHSERTITLFDVNTHQMIGSPLNGHKANISGVVFGDGGQTMYSADEEGVIFRWNLNVDSWQTLAASVAGRGFTKDEAKDYLDRTSAPALSDAPTLLKLADAAALQKADSAKELFVEAMKAAIASKDSMMSNNVCWQGSLDGFAAAVLPAGDSAVEDANEDEKAFYRDARGLARALAGKKQEAIEDFRAFTAWAERHKFYSESVSKRREWIQIMEKQKDPFTDQTLRMLRNESGPLTLN